MKGLPALKKSVGEYENKQKQEEIPDLHSP
jgi:hypothetical protein